MCGTDHSYGRAAQPFSRTVVEPKKIWPPESFDASQDTLDAALVANSISKVASVPPTFAVLDDKLSVNGVSASIIVLGTAVFVFDTNGDEASFEYEDIDTITLLP